MNHQQQFWQIAMAAAIMGASGNPNGGAPEGVAKRAAQIADAATDELNKRLKQGAFGDEA